MQYSPLAARRADPCTGADCDTPTGDGSTLLPTTALGRFYVVGALPTARTRTADGGWRVHPAFVTLVGTATGTRVTVITRGATEGSADGSIPSLRRGDRREFTLDEGDVVQLLSAATPGCDRASATAADGATICPPTADEDLSGTRIEATAPLAVFVGHECARVPWNGGPCMRHEEQLPPLLSLGPRYVLAPEPGGTARWRVVAPYDDTRVELTPSSVLADRTLAAGEAVDLDATAPVELRASRPVLVVSVGAGLSVEAPTAQWRSVSEVHAPFGFTTEVDLSATLGTGALIDDHPLTLTADTRLPGAVTWRVALAPGLHRIAADTPMGVLGVRVRVSSLRRVFSIRGGSDLRDLPVPD
ncbi:MAG: IgGFc-binding protein [Polyangiales bacterium]